MKKFLLLFFSGFTTMAVAQSEVRTAPGSNADAAAPVNVSVRALRPAQPAQHSSVPVQNPGQFYVKDDKPVTSTGNPIPEPKWDNNQSKEQLLQQFQENRRAEKAKNMAAGGQNPGQETTFGSPASSGNGALTR